MYEKLVRDNIIDIIKENGEHPIFEVLDDESFKFELERKLLEECKEVINSFGNDRIEEFADLLEVMLALIDLEGKTFEDINFVREQKKEKRGGFSKRLYLKDVE